MSRRVEGGRVADRRGSRSQQGPRPGQDKAYRGWRALLNPVWCYNGFLTTVTATTVFGLVMVFSSSSVDLVARGQSPWNQALRQGIYCLIGLVVSVVAAHIRVGTYARFSLAFLIFSQFVQALTFTRLGLSTNGNAGWISFRGVTMQPAEMLKLALCIWLPKALMDARRRHDKLEEHSWLAYVTPVAGFMISFILIMAGKDLGTAMIVVIIGFAAFLVSGFSLKWLLSLSLLGLAGIIAFAVMGSSNRMKRIMATYGQCSGQDVQSVCYQSIHGMYAMASGGLTGVGLGNSREKWNYLPEAHNDFIFAVIGEELGFLGAALVVLAFVVMGWCMVRLALTTRDRYAAMVLTCLAVWIVGQALVNICVVLGILPVMGLPLPFVSAGGTALILCLMAAGVAVRMMRTQDDVRASVEGD
ncbi:putative peptidoglycan glycosyltransferase FtsW [Bifidobacterium sp. IMAU50988]|uniref:Probable peptidoglycan glycosyltransferase FtsW n=2 Tax=Bifidobacterium favimelis TaxID=3122979 RepID=A0ABU8ZPH7_9BIFI